MGKYADETKYNDQLRETIEKMDGKSFWQWVGGWYDEESIMDMVNNWNMKTREAELAKIKKITRTPPDLFVDLDDALANISDETFWDWVSTWLDEESVMDTVQEWDEETSKLELTNARKIMRTYKPKQATWNTKAKFKSMPKHAKGWHKEPINHALASKGIKVGKSRTKR